ncbi:tetratricopeptide repeat protein [Cellvibrio japonicus]|uniref:Putative TPR domain protein n=1 Tax=Cellvibrio japonicus (strain Ueda107) TaxID=498211 RepID=B3PLB7_CELJU|nr:hypothetical protein [Cellvibrio japonicus]ACE82951.1 putative TPR domain protein [Cellvibrio japonicus Ueda107]QEI11571.1 hypothetical protein FY117_04575 [Cellvibrio japonicus]QEI15145.1 hypothetical protein FY116_04575 [Cellvibrio japonicus]QEI18725.1 hypothetical protein FY115_04575 [Cellvibrio japonicus]
MKIINKYVFLSWFLLSGCSSVVHDARVSPNDAVLAQALSGTPILGRDYQTRELPDEDLFTLTPEMQRFADEAVAGKRGQDNKAEALHVGLMGAPESGGRGISYSAYSTNTARDAFYNREANCLSYTLLYVSMAKYIGLNAHYNEVLLPPTWDMRGDNTYLFMRHVNAKVVLPKLFRNLVRVADVGSGDDIVVDLELRLFRANYKQREISKDQIAAQFYSNRGMELAANGEFSAAFLNLRKALLLEPKASYIWSNFGSLYRRQGLLPEAEAIYLRGLNVNPSDYTIMHNLAGLYREMGDDAKQKEYMSRVRRHRSANPYYQYKVAQEKLDAKEYGQARLYIEKAIKQEKKEPRFYRLAIEIYEAMGDQKAADRARELLDKSYEG